MTKYTKHGVQVLVIGEANVGEDKGFIAKPIYTYTDEDSDEGLNEAPQYYSSKELFDIPPTLMYDNRIAELKRNIEGLEMSYLDKSNKISDKINEINAAEKKLRELKNMMPKFAEHPILEMVYRYIMGEYEWVLRLDNLQIDGKGGLRFWENFSVKKGDMGYYLHTQYSEDLGYHDQTRNIMVFATQEEAKVVVKNRVLARLRGAADQKPQYIQELFSGILRNDKDVIELRERLVKAATERENKALADKLKKEIEEFEVKKKELDKLIK